MLSFMLWAALASCICLLYSKASLPHHVAASHHMSDLHAALNLLGLMASSFSPYSPLQGGCPDCQLTCPEDFSLKF